LSNTVKASVSRLEAWAPGLTGVVVIVCLVYLLDELGLSISYPWSGLWECVFSGFAGVGMIVVLTEIIIWSAKLWRRLLK
jgi:hypothetical protein